MMNEEQLSTKELNVLLIEDNPDDAELIEHELNRTTEFKVHVLVAATKKDLREVIRQESFDLILCDYYLQANFSFEDARIILREFDLLGLPFILISGSLNDDDIDRLLAEGIYEYVEKRRIRFRLNRVIERELLLSSSYDDLLRAMAGLLEYKHLDTREHSNRVVEKSVALARSLGWGEVAITHLRRGALLHDIGKIGVPDAILLKEDELTLSERITIQSHPQKAYDLLKTIPFLKDSLAVPYCHHEKWNGTGYPRGLKGIAIPLSARLFSIIDVYDALTSDRPYREAWDQTRTLEYIQSKSGVDFDPTLVKKFISFMESGNHGNNVEKVEN